MFYWGWLIELQQISGEVNFEYRHACLINKRSFEMPTEFYLVPLGVVYVCLFTVM